MAIYGRLKVVTVCVALTRSGLRHSFLLHYCRRFQSPQFTAMEGGRFIKNEGMKLAPETSH